MVQTLESIRGGGGSIKVGTTGTISSLISRELTSTKLSTKVDSFPTSVSSGNITPRKSRLSKEEASNVKKTKDYTGRRHQIPMLIADDDDISVQETSIREDPNKRASCMVEIVNIKCLNPDKTWLRKLGFAKLSNSFS